MDKIDNTLGYKTRILNEFDENEFEILYEDNKAKLYKNIGWSTFKMFHDDTDENRKQFIKRYYQNFFGVKAKLQGRFVFCVYHESRPNISLFYCSVYKDYIMRALQYDVTMFGRDHNNSKSWIRQFYSVTGEVFKPMVLSMGMNGYYYLLNNNGDFVEKDMRGNKSIVTEKMYKRKFPENTRLVTCWYK